MKCHWQGSRACMGSKQADSCRSLMWHHGTECMHRLTIYFWNFRGRGYSPYHTTFNPYLNLIYQTPDEGNLATTSMLVKKSHHPLSSISVPADIERRTLKGGWRTHSNYLNIMDKVRIPTMNSGGRQELLMNNKKYHHT